MARLESIASADINEFAGAMEAIRMIAGEEDIADPKNPGKTWNDWYIEAVDALVEDDAETFRKALKNMHRIVMEDEDEDGEA